MSPLECDHSGFHSGVGRLSLDFSSIRFVLVCDDCGSETREVHVEHYAPDYDPSGTRQSRERQQAA
jgi:hypothetical protein